MPFSLFSNSSWIKQSNKASSTNVIGFGGALFQGAVQTQINSATVLQTVN
jgi:hypothetical protein